jgi:hypothetical protein
MMIFVLLGAMHGATCHVTVFQPSEPKVRKQPKQATNVDPKKGTRCAGLVSPT